MSDEPSVRDLYLVKSVVHASRLLSAFRSSGEALPLRDIAGRERPAEEHGVPASLHARALRDGREGRRKSSSLFGVTVQAEAVPAGLCRRGDRLPVFERSLAQPRTGRGGGGRRAHRRQSVQSENRAAQRRHRREKVDLVIEFQTDEHVAPIVSAEYREANIPLIAIEARCSLARPIFGANNYEAGLIGGRYSVSMGQAAVALRAHHVERAGSLPKTAVYRHAGRHERGLPAARAVPGLPPGRRREVRRELRSDATAPALQQGAPIIDWSDERSERARALRAFQEAGRTDACAIMGQNASPEGRAGLWEPGTRLGLVAYFPERRRADRRGGARHPPSSRRAAGRCLRQTSTRHARDGEPHYPTTSRRRRGASPRDRSRRAHSAPGSTEETLPAGRRQPGLHVPWFALASLASQQIAFAQSWGRIGRRVIVRRA